MRFARWSGGCGAEIIGPCRYPAHFAGRSEPLAAVCLLGLIPGALLTGLGADTLAVLAFLVPLYGTALFAYLMRPDLPIARLLLVAASCWTVNLSMAGVLDGIHEQEGLVSELWPVVLLGGFTEMGALVFSALFVALFPDGVYGRPYERFAARSMLTLLAVPALAVVTTPTVDVAPEAAGRHEVSNPLQVGGLSGLDGAVDALAHLSGLAFAAAIVLLFLRYRRSGQEQRSQIRLVLVVAFAGVVGAEVLWLLTPFETAGIVWATVCATLLPVAVLVAILRYRLLEADILIRKSLVYGALWILIAVAYVGAAAALGIAAGGRVPLAVAVLLTIVATLAFQPARRRLEALADRWVFGERLGRLRAADPLRDDARGDLRPGGAVRPAGRYRQARTACALGARAGSSPGGGGLRARSPGSGGDRGGHPGGAGRERPAQPRRRGARDDRGRPQGGGRALRGGPEAARDAGPPGRPCDPQRPPGLRPVRQPRRDQGPGRGAERLAQAARERG